MKEKIGLDIQKFEYNKTYSKDGITQEVDTNKKYIGYNVNFQKNYFDCKNKAQLIDEIYNDLSNLLENLKKIKEEKENDNYKCNR